MQLSKDRRQRAKIDAVRFKPLIASPAVGPFIMPASATLFALSIAGCAAGTTAATYTSSSGAKAVKTPLLVAGGFTPIGFVEKGITLTPATGFEIYMDSGLGRRVKIAEGA